MLVFLKLGGSLITDKSQPETARYDVITRIAGEIKEALDARPDLSLLIGHGSGSFGHMVASRYNTHQGVTDRQGWVGFAKVAAAAAKLNQIVLEALDAADVPVFRIQPSASALCSGKRLIHMAIQPIEQALKVGLVPLVHGDVAIDDIQGGTIISTEDVFDYLARSLRPAKILLAGDYNGVLDADSRVIPSITPATLDELRGILGSSSKTDVTGGMFAKVTSMLTLCEAVPGLSVRIFSGAAPGDILHALSQENFDSGTLLRASK
jgi:isopentenyl phosphate kinase